MAKIKKRDRSADKNVKKLERSFIIGGVVKWYRQFGEQLDSSSKY